MSDATGLQSGARVAVVGGGLCGSAVATALAQGARARHRNLHIEVYERPTSPKPAEPPVVLSPECRARLASLGCRFQLGATAFALQGIEVFSQGTAAQIPGPQEKLWLLDAWDEGLSGRELISRALSAAAAIEGVRYVPRAAERVEPLDAYAAARAPMSGRWVIRAAGAATQADAVVIASALPSGESPMVTMAALHARLTADQAWVRELDTSARWVKLLVAPTPSVDLLYLIPCRGSWHAVAIGAWVTSADLGEALLLARAQLRLPEGLKVREVRRSTLPVGIGTGLVERAKVSVGSAAFGHPFQLGVSEALTSCSHAAVALLDQGAELSRLRERYLDEGVSSLLHDALAATRALGVLRHAGPRAAQAFAPSPNVASGPSVSGPLGVSAPSAEALLRRARWQRFLNALERPWRRRATKAASEPQRGLVYVVDDDAEAREALAELLRSRGLVAVTFSDELSLLAAIERRPPQVLLLDVVLSWMDGLKLLETIRANRAGRAVRVWMMSGVTWPTMAQRARAGGAAGFLAKPFTAAAIDRLLADLGAPAHARWVPRDEGRAAPRQSESLGS